VAKVICTAIMSYLLTTYLLAERQRFFPPPTVLLIFLYILKNNNQPLLKAMQRHKVSFLIHQRKGISLAEVICIAIMSYLQHNCWQKGNSFFATYSTPDTTVHPDEQQSTTAEGHSKA
jgi:hypothetical protein